ncbi:hypothetical protein B0H67DRAFT_685408 [Lasiosphaeris hirsuta]|uniref:Nudix hydrolase domain-containing protein n=1 Tax=Lasiosphaeris hirsuta TaxID=260670 RepID=A0AA40A9R8_9PEZI|nr:hypothetical protein B0H67DRAFT_685408 [Lasiosphaeris hirsuta]
MAQPPFSNLQLVEQVDSWPYFTKDPDAYKKHMLGYHYFFIQGYSQPFGYVHNRFVSAMEWPEYCRLMNETLRFNHESQKVPTLRHWANEELPIYTSTGEHVLDFDGCGVDMFGIVNYSVHMTGWVMTAEGIKIWVPRRAMDKMSFPGMLDNTVGGSLATREKAIDGIVRECEEEICLAPAYTRSNIRACSTNSFQLTVTDLLEPACQHQVQYLYEIELGQDIVSKIGDGEVGELNLLSIEQLLAAMRNDEVKLTCNMTYLALLVRHGYINAENEPNLVEICSRLHCRHEALRCLSPDPLHGRWSSGL